MCFLGYIPTNKGYKCFDPISEKLFISRHVTYHENSFPFQKSLSFSPHIPLNLPPLLPTPPLSLPTTPQNSIPTSPLRPNFQSTPPGSPFNSISSPTHLPHLRQPTIAHSLQSQPLHRPNSPHPSPHSPSTPNSHHLNLPSPTSPHSHQQSSSSSISRQVHVSSIPEALSSPKPTATNTHNMLTRSKTCHSKPKVKSSHLSVITTTTSTNLEPTTYNIAVKSPAWRKAMSDEFYALQTQGTWSLVPPPSNRKIIECKWVFRLK